MFETIGTLFSIGFWAAAIILFLFGVILCIDNLVNGNGWKKFLAVISVAVGIFTFIRMYAWSGSIAWGLLTTGIVLGFVTGNFFSTGEPNLPKKEKYGFGKAYLDVYCEYELQKQAYKDAMRELDK